MFKYCLNMILIKIKLIAMASCQLIDNILTVEINKMIRFVNIISILIQKF